MNWPRFLRRLTTLAALALLALPLVVALLAGLQHRRLPGDVGAGSGIVLVLVLVYLVWTPLVVIGLVWVLDHLGIHYTAPKREPRLSRKQRKRTAAGLRFLAASSTLKRPGRRASGSAKADAGTEDARGLEPRAGGPPSQGGVAGGGTGVEPHEDARPARPRGAGGGERPRDGGSDAQTPDADDGG